MLIRLLLIVIVYSNLASLNAQISAPIDYVSYKYSDFKQIKTTHFKVIYPQKGSEPFFIPSNMEQIALKVSEYAEESYSVLSKRLNYSPSGLINIVLIDSQDQHNGMATPIPQNTIHLYVVPPFEAPAFDENSNWLHETTTHELTHIINLSTSRGYSKILKAIFGNIVSINGLQPMNVIEGLAVYEETKLSPSGRGRSSFLHTHLRTLAYEDKILNNNKFSLEHSLYTLEDWPLGDVPYLYGYLLFEHLDSQGVNNPDYASYLNSGKLPYINISAAFEELYNQNLTTIWEQIKIKKNNYYQNWLSEIKKQEVTNIKELFLSDENTYSNTLPATSPDNTKIAYLHKNKNQTPKIIIRDLKSNNIITSTFSHDSTFIRWINNDELFFNELDIDHSNSYYVLKKLNTSTGHISDIDESQRIIDITPSIYNKTFYTVRLKTGISEILLEQINDSNSIKTISSLYKSEFMAVITKIAVKKDESGQSSIVFTERTADGNSYIKELVNSKNIKTIYKSEGVIRDLIVNNNEIYFISSPDKIFNIYKLKNNTAIKLTNAVTGIFDFNSTLEYVSYYTSTGFRLGKILVNKNSNFNNVAFKNEHIIEQKKPTQKEPENQKSNYNSFKDLLPKFWLPNAYYSNTNHSLGIITYGADATFRHEYSINANYELLSNKPYGSVSYSEHSFFTDFSIDATADVTNYRDTDNSIITDTEYTTGLSIFLPFYDDRLETGLVLRPEYSYSILNTQDGANVKKAGLAVGWYISNTFTPQFYLSIPQQGYSAYLSYGIYPASLNSESFAYKVASGFEINLPVYYSHIFRINNANAYMFGGNPNDYEEIKNSQSLMIKNPRYLFRGYDLIIAGRSLYTFNIEYKFPLLIINKGSGTFPLFLRKAHITLATDITYKSRDYHEYKFFNSAGAELNTEFFALYHLPLSFKIGYFKSLTNSMDELILGFYYTRSLY